MLAEVSYDACREGYDACKGSKKARSLCMLAQERTLMLSQSCVTFERISILTHNNQPLAQSNYFKDSNAIWKVEACTKACIN